MAPLAIEHVIAISPIGIKFIDITLRIPESVSKETAPDRRTGLARMPFATEAAAFAFSLASTRTARVCSCSMNRNA